MCQTKLSLPRLYVILKARELYNMPSSFVLFCRICPAVVMRVMVPVLPMMDQRQGGHSSEPPRPFLPSSSSRALIQICTLGGGRWGHQSIRAAFHRCSQQHGGEVMARSSWPGSSTRMVWWADGSQPIAYGEILSIVLTRNMRRKIVLRAPAWRKLIGLV